MLGIKVPLNIAEKVKIEIIEKDVLDNNYRYIKEKEHIIFPIKKKISIRDTKIADFNFKESTKILDMKDILKEELSKEEFEKLKTAHDAVGSIAIIEIDEELRHKEKIIANALLDSNKQIKTVLRKDGGHEGDFRVQKMKFLAGVDTRQTITVENGVRLKLNVETVYYSPRLSTERKRIAEQIKSGEKVLVMFSGCGPFACVIAKNTSAKELVAIEINPDGHDFAVKNLVLNKIKNVMLINDDVKDAVPLLAGRGVIFDRIVMPAPHNANEFLDVALTVAKKGSIIHFYDFKHEDNFQEIEVKAKQACEKAGFKYEKIELVKAGQHAPHIFRVCLDFIVS
ncbi:class I SAM-dependent methyltransferase family protein [Candidatus Woesearchaeota archaeon]|nr:class I SAM-dependent methyltransferase family protein [Candidatus Woesearchaeota archaeon]MCF7900882.1 class I SAM-dependent methyltransferase family protein [Candidatus Woesearchaeota archaeon]MCF8013069.1 class I SAM-dependent methyltransferase family protein [Candidatus Woesearchaeota archaeon]